MVKFISSPRGENVFKFDDEFSVDVTDPTRKKEIGKLILSFARNTCKTLTFRQLVGSVCLAIADLSFWKEYKFTKRSDFKYVLDDDCIYKRRGEKVLGT